MEDELSAVLELVDVRAVVSGGFAVRGPWVSRGATGAMWKFLAMVRGRAVLTTDGDDPCELGPGDVALLNGRSRLELRGGDGDGPPREISPVTDRPGSLLLVEDRSPEDVVVGGHIDLTPPGRTLLLQALPPVACVRGTAAGGLRPTLERLFEEVAGGRIGAGFAIRQHAQLLLLDVLRAWLDQAEPAPGWLRLAADTRLRPAVALLHSDPGRTWRLTELARAAAMSRTTFTERFRAVAGVPPLTYLVQRRMLLAQQALRHEDTPVGALATRLGYASAAAFSTAFTREVGQSPQRYRRHADLAGPHGA